MFSVFIHLFGLYALHLLQICLSIMRSVSTCTVHEDSSFFSPVISRPKYNIFFTFMKLAVIPKKKKTFCSTELLYFYLFIYFLPFFFSCLSLSHPAFSLCFLSFFLSVCLSLAHTHSNTHARTRSYA